MRNETVAKLVKGGLALGGLAIGAIMASFVKAAPEEYEIDLTDMVEQDVVDITDIEVKDN